jgi:hypothetical protein
MNSLSRRFNVAQILAAFLPRNPATSPVHKMKPQNPLPSRLRDFVVKKYIQVTNNVQPNTASQFHLQLHLNLATNCHQQRERANVATNH